MQVAAVLVQPTLEYHRFLQELVVLVEVVLVVYQQVLLAQLTQVVAGVVAVIILGEQAVQAALE
jgi:hypothetical protein